MRLEKQRLARTRLARTARSSSFSLMEVITTMLASTLRTARVMSRTTTSAPWFIGLHTVTSSRAREEFRPSIAI